MFFRCHKRHARIGRSYNSFILWFKYIINMINVLVLVCVSFCIRKMTDDFFHFRWILDEHVCDEPASHHRSDWQSLLCISWWFFRFCFFCFYFVNGDILFGCGVIKLPKCERWPLLSIVNSLSEAHYFQSAPFKSNQTDQRIQYRMCWLTHNCH